MIRELLIKSYDLSSKKTTTKQIILSNSFLHEILLIDYNGKERLFLSDHLNDYYGINLRLIKAFEEKGIKWRFEEDMIFTSFNDKECGITMGGSDITQKPNIEPEQYYKIIYDYVMKELDL